MRSRSSEVSGSPRRTQSVLVLSLLGVLTLAIAAGPVVAGSTASAQTAPAQVFPSPWEAVQEIIEEIVKSLADGAENLIDQTAIEFLESATADVTDEFTRLEVTLPAPGDPLEPDSWVTAHEESEWWNATWVLYWSLSALFMIPLAVMGVFHYSNRGVVGGDPAHQENRVREIAKLFVFYIVGWVLISFYLHFMNTISMGLAPSGMEFMETSGNISRLSVGIVLGAFLLVFHTGMVILGLFVIIAQWILTFFLFGMMPASLFGRAFGIPELRTMGDQAVAALIALPLIKAGQAAFLRFMFILPLDYSNPGSSVMTLCVTIIGLWIVYYKIPITGMKRAIPEATITTSGRIESIGGRGARQRRQAVRSKADDIAARAKQGTGTAARRVTPSRSRGSSSSSTKTTQTKSSSSKTTTASGSQSSSKSSRRKSKSGSGSGSTASGSGASQSSRKSKSDSGASRSDRSVTQRIRNYHRSKTKTR